MPANSDRAFRPRMTLRQIGIFVIFAAVASAVVMPQARNRGDGPSFWLPFFLTAAMEIPYALMLPTLILVRSGPLKNWILSAMCLVPIPAFVGLLACSFHMDFRAAAVVLLVAAIPMSLAFAYLSRFLLPRSCPGCSRPTMLRDLSVPMSRHFPKGSEPRTCLACGARFRRSRGGPWVDVDLLEPLELLAPTNRIRYQPKGRER